MDKTGNIEGEKTTTTDELMVFILGGSALLLLFLLLIGCKLLAKVSEKCRKCEESLTRKLLYGSFIRYLLLGTLKLQMTFCTGLAIGVFIKETKEEPAKDISFKATAIVVVLLL